MIEAFLQSWNDPHARHAMLVHVPIALATLGALPLTWLCWSRFRSTPARWVCLAWFLIAATGAFLASEAGEDAEPTVVQNGAPLTPEESEAVHEHEELGENAWIWLLLTASLCAATFIPARGVRVAAGVLAVVSGAWSLGAVAYTAHLGGRLVYVHGLGVPVRNR